MIDETRARELYIRIKALREHQQQLQGHLEELDEKTVELREMIGAVQESTQIQQGEELLVPLANGIFLPATAHKTDKLILNIGASSAVEKTPQETVDILEKQLSELAEFRQELLKQYKQVQQESARVEQEVQQEVGDV